MSKQVKDTGIQRTKSESLSATLAFGKCKRDCKDFLPKNPSDWGTRTTNWSREKLLTEIKTIQMKTTD